MKNVFLHETMYLTNTVMNWTRKWLKIAEVICIDSVLSTVSSGVKQMVFMCVDKTKTYIDLRF